MTFDEVKAVALTLPEVEASTKYDGSPVLKAGGSFFAGIATDESADADTLVVRMEHEDRQYLLEDAPDTYYVTEYYERHPVVLVRMELLEQDALRDLLSVSWRLAMKKAGRKVPT
jgi:hypothetical protein